MVEKCKYFAKICHSLNILSSHCFKIAISVKVRRMNVQMGGNIGGFFLCLQCV